MKKWTVQDSQIILNAPPYMVVRQEKCLLPDGHLIPDYYVVTEPDIVVAFVLTSKNELLLVEQYKHGIGEICLELPGGLSDGGEPLDEAKREIREETGYESDNWEFLGKYITNPTRFDNHIYAFIARNARLAGEQELDPAESIRVHTMAIPDVLEAVAQGRISAVHSVATIFHALARIQKTGNQAG